MGVKREKEPLTGISPVRLLFERSLHSMYKKTLLFAFSDGRETSNSSLSRSLLIEMKRVQNSQDLQ